MDWMKVVSSVLVAIILAIGSTIYALNSKIVKIEARLDFELKSKIQEIERRIDSGIKGDAGPIGVRGPKGDVGPAGPQGLKGDPANLPVGTIIASLLEPTVFSKKFGKSWHLADGSNISSQSEFTTLTGSFELPDCRGMFLRGHNAGKANGKKDPNTKRPVGSYQPDSINNHIVSSLYDNLAWNAEFIDTAVNHNGDSPKQENALVATETRPKNISTYFYIKID